MRKILRLLSLGCCVATVVSAQTPQLGSGLSVIVVERQADASDLRTRIQSGTSFEALAMRYSIDPTAPLGGYMGTPNSPLRPELQAAAGKLVAGAVSPVTRIGDKFVLLRRSTPNEDAWRSEHGAAVEALQNGRVPEALTRFIAAVAQAEKLGRDDVRAAESLNALARIHRIAGSYSDSEACSRRSLAILEKALGANHPNLLEGLSNLATTLQAQERFTDAAPVYRRILSIRWNSPSGASDAADVLEKLADVLGLGYIRHRQLDGALKTFRQALVRAPLDKDLYVAIRDGLMTVTLVAEAEAVMQHAVSVYPESRQLRYQLGELYVKSERHEKALAVFEEASRLAPHSNPALDRVQLSAIYEKIAEMNTFLVRFDNAVVAAKTALEIHPGNIGARLTLADLFLRRNLLDDAAEEYMSAISLDSRNANAHYGLAQVDLTRGRFEDAAATAARALAIDPVHQRSRYVRAMALIRANRDEEGQKVLQEYQRYEVELDSIDARKREASEFDRNATAKLSEGQLEAGAALLREGIRLQPGATVLLLKLGLVQGRLGLHREAVATFQKLVELKADDFLVHRSLYREYEALGDVAGSGRHRAIYLQKYDAALGMKVSG